MNILWSNIIRLGIESGVPLISIWHTLSQRQADVSYIEVQTEHTRLLRERKERLK